MRYSFFTVAVSLSLLACLPLTSAAEADWPQWRGPARDGLSAEKGLLKSWPDGGPKLAWRVEGLGAGYSGLAIRGDRIFTMGDKDGASHVIALDRSGGKQVWTTKVGKAGAPGWGGFSGPRCTPTLDDGLLYAVGQYGEIVCLKAASGDEVWRKSMPDDLEGPRPEWGFSESPLVDGEKLLCTPGGPKGTLAALDKMTGKVIWRSGDLTDGAHYASIIVEEHNGTRQYIQLTKDNIFGVEAKDGKLLWKAEWPGKTAVIPTPIFHEGLVYVTSGYGVGCNVFRVGKDNAVTALYDGDTRKAMKNHHGGVILLGDHVYGHSDKRGWICQELESGKVVWSEKSKLGKGSIAYADGHFYLRAESGKGTVALIEATPQGYREKSRFNQPDRTKKNSWTHPIIAGGKMFLRDQDLLLCYDIKAR